MKLGLGNPSDSHIRKAGPLCKVGSGVSEIDVAFGLTFIREQRVFITNTQMNLARYYAVFSKVLKIFT